MHRTAVLASAVAAAVATGAVLAVSGGAQDPGGQTIQLVTKNFKYKFNDNPPKIRTRNGLPGAGDTFAFTADATDTAGAKVGTLHAIGTVVKGGKNGRGVGTGVYELAGGDIYLVVRFNPADDQGTTVTGAITGGTRAYAGAHGTFTSVDRRGTAGGDPSDDTVTLLP